MPRARREQGVAGDLARRSRELYDDTSSPVWRLAVYDALHEGWEFANLGGRHLLDAFARRACIGPRTRVLELCAGQAATCRYLAERYGCPITGVEWNRHQIEQGRAALGARPPSTSARVRLVHADVARWRTLPRYDAAFCLDSLMLMPRPRAAVAAAADALVEGGLLMVAVIAAGAALDPPLRRYVSENDGMVSLLPSEKYVDMLGASGFAEVQAEDRTPLAADASQTILEAFDRAREAIVLASGEEEYRTSREAAVVYLDAFRREGLVYSVITGWRARAPLGRRPAAAA